MIRLAKIHLDLNTFKILLFFHNGKDPLVLHFDSPSRKFYFSLIALIVVEMKKQRQPGFIHIRKHEQLIRLLDESLAAQNASKTLDRMWEKIRITWRYSLPDLETAANFKIEDRDLLPPYEKGGKYRYDCADEESDVWANLFETDESNPWRLKFAVDSASLDLDRVHLILDNLKDSDAWQEFTDRLRKIKEAHPVKIDSKEKTTPLSFYKPLFVICAIVIIAGWALWYFYISTIFHPVEHGLSSKSSIVVLPFSNISGDPDKEYLSDGITEELINNLARIKDLHVISRTSAFYFKDKNFDIRTIGEKLQVENVLEGSVQVSGDKLRVTAQLIKVADDSHLWAESYERKMEDIFDTQEGLTREIACSLKSRLGCTDAGDAIKRYTDNVEAYKLYLKGRFIWSTLKQKNMIEYYNKALALDPRYAPAYIGLAEAYIFLGFFFGDASYINAKEAALKALEIDGSLADAHALLGQVRLFFEFDLEGAKTAIKKAIEMNPDSSMAHLIFALYLNAIGEPNNAVAEMKLAVELDPFSFFHNLQYAVSEVFNGQYNEAIKQMESTLEMFPNNPELLTHMGLCHVLKKNYQQGIAILENAASLMPRISSLNCGFLGYAYGVSNDKINANKMLEKSLELYGKGKITPTTIAVIHSGLKETDKAFEWLNIAFEKRDPQLAFIKVAPPFLSLHTDPRWVELMKKMGFEEKSST